MMYSLCSAGSSGGRLARIASANLNAIGGFKADSEDGTLELDLTFEEILRSREDEVRASILGKE